MAGTGIKGLKKLCEWFNQLTDEKQINIIDYFADKTDELILDNAEKVKISELIDKITFLAVKYENNKDKVLTNLIKYGLDKIVSSKLYAFCESQALPFIDAKWISTMEKDNLHQTCNFVINKMVLYNDYFHYSFSEFHQLTGLNDYAKSASVGRFLSNHYQKVGNREISPLSLNKILINDYNLSQEFVDEIIKPLNDNLQDVHLAALQDSVSELLEKLSVLSSTIPE